MREFKPKKMVGWFDVKQLASTAVRSILSSIFGSRADRREVMVAITNAETYDHSKQDEIWVDYMSDTGDGFDSTFSMMTLISAHSITVETEGELKVLPRGNIVILGGDEVYPAPTEEEYHNRFIGPFEAASAQSDSNKTTDLYALPGNHDWYDGLSNFIEIFCRKKKIGSFQTKQNRSYFAIKVSENTWFWAIDIQLSAQVDENQFLYFENVADTEMKAGDHVVLCTAEPAWVYHNLYPDTTKYIHLETFENRCIVNKNLIQKLTLTGDLHHYARYSQNTGEKNSKHKITSGGGGAFLHPTHNIPKKLTRMREGDFELKETFPKVKTSKRLAFLNLLFSWNNVGFGLFLSSIHLVMAYTLYSTSLLYGDHTNIFLDFAETSKLFDPEITAHLIQTFVQSPVAILILVLFIFGFYAFCDKKSSKYKFAGLFGLFHGVMHVVLMLSLFSFLAYFTHVILKVPTGLPGAVVVSLMVYIIGGFLSGVLVGLYLLISSLLMRMHDDEAFSSSKIKGYKNFLRIHVKDNQLTIYPIGIERVPKWKRVNGLFRANKPLQPILIDEPITIDLN